LNSTGVTKLSLRDLDSGSQNEEERPKNKVIKSRKSSVGNLVSIFEKSQIFEQPKNPEIERSKPSVPTRPWEASLKKPLKSETQPNPIFQPKPILSQKPLQFQQKPADLESTDIDSFFPINTSTPRKLRNSASKVDDFFDKFDRQSISRKSTSNRHPSTDRPSTTNRQPAPQRQSTSHRPSTSHRQSTSHRPSHLTDIQILVDNQPLAGAFPLGIKMMQIIL